MHKNFSLGFHFTLFVNFIQFCQLHTSALLCASTSGNTPSVGLRQSIICELHGGLLYTHNVAASWIHLLKWISPHFHILHKKKEDFIFIYLQICITWDSHLNEMLWKFEAYAKTSIISWAKCFITANFSNILCRIHLSLKQLGELLFCFVAIF